MALMYVYICRWRQFERVVVAVDCVQRNSDEAATPLWRLRRCATSPSENPGENRQARCE